MKVRSGGNIEWHLICLLCGVITYTDLVRMQQHGMEEHGVIQADLQNVTRHRIENEDGYIYTLPDGRDWLMAEQWTTSSF